MVAWVADYVSRIPSADLKAAGVVGVCRYLADSTSIGKIIGQAEYDELRGAGIHVILNWEQLANDWLGGAVKGAAHAASAVRQAKALGHPAGSVIPGSADFDMSSTQWNSAGRAYAVAFRDGLHAGGYRAGVYGPYDVLTWVRDLGGFELFWQAGMSTAWSGGRNRDLWPGAHLRQRRYATITGHDVDYNDIVRSDWRGAEMALMDDNDFKALAYRLEAWVNGRDTVIGGPTKGEKVLAWARIADTLTKSDAFLTAVAAKVAATTPAATVEVDASAIQPAVLAALREDAQTARYGRLAS